MVKELCYCTQGHKFLVSANSVRNALSECVLRPVASMKLLSVICGPGFFSLKRHETSVEPATSTENTESRHCLSCQMLKPLLENSVQMT